MKNIAKPPKKHIKIFDRVSGGEIIINPKPNSSLSEMLDKITEQNIHEELKTGGPVGKEIW